MIHEKDLSTSVMDGVGELRRHGVKLAPTSQVTFDLNATMRSHRGVMIFPAMEINGSKAYDVIKAVGAPAKAPDTTFEHLWSCTKEHYGLTAATAITGAMSIPIPKIMVGAWVHKGSSTTTNLSSIVGWKSSQEP